jgi:hypothetical protein
LRLAFWIKRLGLFLIQSQFLHNLCISPSQA